MSTISIARGIAVLGTATVVWASAAMAQSTAPSTAPATTPPSATSGTVGTTDPSAPWKSPTATATDTRVSGKIKSIEHHSDRAIVTLEDGTQLTMADKAVMDRFALRDGMDVTAWYARQGDRNVITGLEHPRGAMTSGPVGTGAMAPWKSPTATATDTRVSGKIKNIERHSDRAILTLEDGTQLTMADKAVMDRFALREGMDVTASYAKQGDRNVITGLESRM